MAGVEERPPPSDLPPPDLPPPPPPPPSMAQRGPTLDLAAAFRSGWEVFRADPWPYVGLVVVAYAIFFGVMAVVVAGVWGALALGSEPAAVLVVVAGLPVLLVVVQLPTVWTVRAGSMALDGGPVRFGRVAAPAALVPPLVAIGLVMVGVLVGYVLLVLPGIVFGVMAVFTVHFVIEERLSARDAVRASIDLFRSQPGPALGLFFVPAFVGGLGIYLCGIGVAVSLPVAMIAQVHGFRQLRGRDVPMPPVP